MALLTLSNITIRFSGLPVLDSIQLTIQKGMKLCLLGRNGSGKSTLLKILAGNIEPDSGERAVQQGIEIAILDQGMEWIDSDSLSDLLIHIDERAISFRKLCTQLKLPIQEYEQTPPLWKSLSGGEKRKLLLCATLSKQPDLLILDEPTNHLDIPAIAWLEEYLSKQVSTYVFVTHDRAFARACSRSTAELDRGDLYLFNSSYEQFLKRKDELLEAQQTQWKKFDTLLAQEEAWLRRGIKARRTRDEGRVNALLTMREEHRSRRYVAGTAIITVQHSQGSGKLVADGENLSFSYGTSDQPLFKECNISLQKGDKLAILGPNGAGKTTLLKIILGQLQPSSGSLKLGTNLIPLYFDQARATLDPKVSIKNAITGGKDQVIINGKPKHINAYAQDFLFEPDRLNTPVGILSGGEKNRVALAKLFTQPGNLLILDEPTNDLDTETLEVLEDMIVQFNGTVILVSHDREFIDNTVTDSIYIQSTGMVLQYPGGYSDLLSRYPDVFYQKLVKKSDTNKEPYQTAPNPQQVKHSPKKLSFNEKKEIEQLPLDIQDLEAKLNSIQQSLSDPELYRTDSDGSKVKDLQNQLMLTQTAIQKKYDRWEELDEKKSG
jgi:ATP-binding cassette subfamily F protein uup